MNIVPIAFAFDNNLVMPACICISSLMLNAKEDTFYDIFILHSERERLDRTELDKISQFYKNCRIQYRAVGNEFDDAYEIRGITTPAYYRLLIPELILEYDKIIYADVDIIFRLDLSDLYSIELKNNYVGAVLGLSISLFPQECKYTKELGMVGKEYFQSGFLLINSRLIRTNSLCEFFKHLSKRKLKFQDQDIINIACENRIYSLSLKYNMTTFAFKYAINNSESLKLYYNEEEIKDSILMGNIHYNGAKPWNGWCNCQDIWWEYYRKSPFYNDKLYLAFYEENLNAIEKWSLWKRLKHLLRYFYRINNA